MLHKQHKPASQITTKRGKWHNKTNGKPQVPQMSTYHPKHQHKYKLTRSPNELSYNVPAAHDYHALTLMHAQAYNAALQARRRAPVSSRQIPLCALGGLRLAFLRNHPPLPLSVWAHKIVPISYRKHADSDDFL